MDEGINMDGASFAVNSHKSVDVLPKDWIRCGPFPLRKNDPNLIAEALSCLCNVVLTLQWSKEVRGTGLRLKQFLGTNHSSLLTVCWRGKVQQAVQQPRGEIVH